MVFVCSDWYGAGVSVYYDPSVCLRSARTCTSFAYDNSRFDQSVLCSPESRIYFFIMYSSVFIISRATLVFHSHVIRSIHFLSRGRPPRRQVPSAGALCLCRRRPHRSAHARARVSRLLARLLVHVSARSRGRRGNQWDQRTTSITTSKTVVKTVCEPVSETSVQNNGQSSLKTSRVLRPHAETIDYWFEPHGGSSRDRLPSPVSIPNNMVMPV